MPDWLQARVAATPEKVALIIEKQRWTFAELDAAVTQIARFLYEKGVRRHDFVAVLMPNSFLYVCLVYGLARLGATLAPLNTRLAAPELAWQLEHTGCRWLFYSQETGEKAGELTIVNCQLSIVNEEAVFLAAAGSLAVDDWPLTIDNSLQAVVFTSGTSGRPKGAMLTFANHFWSATASSYRLGLDPEDRWLCCLPLYHVGGLAILWRSCLYGTAVVLHDGFDLDAINESLDTHRVTLLSLVPTMLYRLLQSRDHWPASLRLILLGGAAAPVELIEQANNLPRKGEWLANQLSIAHRQSPIAAPTYGLTEAASQVATMLPADALRKPGSVGKPLMFTTVRIVDDEGNELPPGQPGEIVVTGPTVTPGYYPNPQSPIPNTQYAIRNMQYATINTADIGYLDQDGDLWLVQRRSDIIISGGENVYPAEVEAALRRHPAVAAVCVVGIPHPEWGQQVAAAVVVREGARLTEEALMQFGRQRLAGYKQPRRIHFVDNLPQTASGKVARQTVASRIISLK